MKCSSKRSGFRREGGGYLTVFLSLSLTAILSLFLCLIEGAEYNGAKLKLLCASDTAMNSTLAEYSQELLSQYGLFFIDTSYGNGSGSLSRTQDHLNEYLQKNVTAKGELPFLSRKSFLGPQDISGSITGARYASDRNGYAVEQQIEAYMAADPAGNIVSDVTNLLSSYDGAGFDLSAFGRNEENAKEKIMESLPEGVENPLADAWSWIELPILRQVFGNQNSLSEEVENTGELISHRENLQKGTLEEADNSHQYRQADAVLEGEYILEKCGCLTDPLNKGKLKYQVEYILSGRAKDKDNLESVLGRILLIREAANCMYLFSDQKKMAEAGRIAGGLSAVTLSPENKELYTAAILLVWGYSESISDLKTLTAGRKVPLLKNESSWNTELVSLLKPEAADGNSSGMSYEDYLRLFLLLENRSTRIIRLEDIMESDIRTTEGNKQFRLDWCIDSYTAEITMTMPFSFPECRLERSITYN